MIRRALVAAVVLVAAGCAVGERPTLSDEAIEDAAGSLQGGSELSVSDGDEPDVIDPDDLGDLPPVVVSPTGVPVPVIGRSAGGYQVQSPCGREVDLVWGQPVVPVDVVIDPGHGGDEQGALGPNGETESEVNLDIARRLATALESRGYGAALTRTSDYRVTIPVRAAITDRLGAEVMVSIHHNSPTPDLAVERAEPGTEVYVQAGEVDSQRLGGLLHEEVVASLAVFDAEWASRTDAGVLTVLNDAGEDAYGIVRRPTTTTALVELAYLSNPTEAVVIGTGEYRQSAAVALADAIVRYFEGNDPGSGFVDEPRLFNPSGDTGGTDGCIDPILE